MSFNPFLPQPKVSTEVEEPRRSSFPAAGVTGPSVTPATSTHAPALHFFQCADCFGHAALETNNTETRCDCGGELDYMGKAKNDRLIVEGVRVPCDPRCTAAIGPKCDCACSGANHGSGALVRVEIDKGGVPIVSQPADLPARLGIAEVFRARYKRALKGYEQKVGTLNGADPVGWQIREQLRHARRFRTQRRRLAAIDAADSLLAQYERPRT